MALVIDAIQKGPGACQHFRVRIDEDGVLHTLEALTRESFDLDMETGSWKGNLVMLWMRYKLANGATFQSLVGQTVVA